MTDYTPNFNLEKYTTGDAANLNDQYNASMDIIDTNLYKVNTNASTALNTANQAITQIQATNDNLAALGVTNETTATALKNKIDTTASNLAVTTETANNAKSNLNALGITDTATAETTKNRWNKAAEQAEINKNSISALNIKTNQNAQIITQAIGYNDNIVVIGDSWVDGYYKHAKHLADSPANAIYDILKPTTKQTLGTSAGGFYATGDDGTFLNRWNAVTDKQHVNRVIIIGGQNDANKMLNDNTPITSIDNSINTLLNTIRTDAPNAIIDIFPMCLAMGESMNRVNAKWSVAPDYRQQVYNLFATKRDIPNVVIHEGAYRAGVWASRAADGGDDGDGAHLSKGGYSAVGHAMGSCILHGTTFFPTQSGFPNESQINGTWNNVSIFETNGILSIQYNVKCNGAQRNGDRIFKIAKQFRVGASVFYKDYSDKYFVSIDGDTLALQGVNNIAANDIIAGGIRLLAGF
nr:MAG: GDSL-like Lipase/Acylhydrolase family protein [Bacteriophage sp.]